jgi:hypothetical protein
MNDLWRNKTGTVIHKGNCRILRDSHLPWVWARNKKQSEILTVARRNEMKFCGFCMKQWRSM